jgi:two-component system, OmpR family, phosphate regulon sensor histidine kinase PhoR
MRKQTTFIFYALTAYVVLQFGWWGLHLIDLTRELNPDAQYVSKRALMILGEGAVFFIIVFLGLWKIRSSIRKELELGRQQHNFVLSVTHELKTPLAGMKLYLQTLLRRKLSREQEEEIITKAIDENLRLERMVENILTVSRMENSVFSFHPEPINIADALQRLLHPFRMYDQLRIDVVCESDLVFATDRFAFESIVSNLLENAVKYAGDSAHIRISCGVDNGKLSFVFSDNGPGVPDGKKSEIFGKFVRLEQEDTRQNKGTGLGLYLVRELVVRQHGTIQVSDAYPEQENKGLKFLITL